MTYWTDFVKSYAKEHNLSYGCALSDPNCSAGYKAKYGVKKPLGKKKETESMMAEDINRIIAPPKQTPQRKQQLSAVKQKLNKTKLQNQLVETLGMMNEDINRQPVQDIAGNFVPIAKKSKGGRKKGSKNKPKGENITMVIEEIKQKKNRGRPKKYSTTEEARKAKIANTIAGAKKRKEKKSEGKGIIDTIKEGVKAVIYGRNDFPPKVRQILSKYGNKNIIGITLGRNPLGATLVATLQLASGGTFQQKLNNTPYDKLFHLFMCIELAGGGKIRIEKNEVINATIGCKITKKDSETKYISSSDIPTGLTLDNALEKQRERMGDKFFTYNARDNNCQDFILGFLRANQIGSETDASWVKQNVDVIFNGNENLLKLATLITDIGARVDVIREGAGLDSDSDSSSVSSSSSSSSGITIVGGSVSDDMEDLITFIRRYGNSRSEFKKNIDPPIAKIIHDRYDAISKNPDLQTAPRPIYLRFRNVLTSMINAIPYDNPKKGGGTSASVVVPVAEEVVGEPEVVVQSVEQLMALVRLATEAEYFSFREQERLEEAIENDPQNRQLRIELYDLKQARPALRQTANNYRTQLHQYYNATPTDASNPPPMAQAQIGRGLKKSNKKGKGCGSAAIQPASSPAYLNISNHISRISNQYFDLINAGMPREEVISGITNYYQLLVSRMNILFSNNQLTRAERVRLIRQITNNSTLLSLNPIDYNLNLEEDANETEIMNDEEEGGGFSKIKSNTNTKMKGKKGKGLGDEFVIEREYNIHPDDKEVVREIGNDQNIEDFSGSKDLVFKYLIKILSKIKSKRGNRFLYDKSGNAPVNIDFGDFNADDPDNPYGFIGKGIKNKKPTNSWITYVKDYAKKHNMKYNDALKDPKLKAGYKSGKGMDDISSTAVHTMPDGTMMKDNIMKKPIYTTMPVKPLPFRRPMKGMGMPSSQEDYIAELYNQANLGANGSVKL
jgi:hypothetical protein